MDTPMTFYKSSDRALCAALLTLGFMAYIYSAGVSALPNPQERIDYWQQNYSELTEVDDPRVANVHHIFGRVLQAAGNRYGVIPRLFIIKENPFNIVLPISIPDGWIILSRQVLWHINFFSALSLLKKDNNVEQKVVSEIQGIFTQTAKIEAKELRADERGILFSAMAGYNPFAIVDEQAGEQGSFFHEWHELLNVSQYEQMGAPNTHPTSSQRSTAVLARLKQVSEQSDLFSLGWVLSCIKPESSSWRQKRLVNFYDISPAVRYTIILQPLIIKSR
ncbi:MAG: hypothetical protein AMJ55_13400 [Gammaproteobacteria bacterium SG8_15]|nr:MAG: hypothetical protein AMJ55_13400 [Gammaproteobacteria bacterium SG8_15]